MALKNRYCFLLVYKIRLVLFWFQFNLAFSKMTEVIVVVVGSISTWEWFYINNFYFSALIDKTKHCVPPPNNQSLNNRTRTYIEYSRILLRSSFIELFQQFFLFLITKVRKLDLTNKKISINIPQWEHSIFLNSSNSRTAVSTTD